MKQIENGMKLFEYENYQDYVEAQTNANKKKLHTHSGVGIEVMREIHKRIPHANNILCHGTRAGWEQKYFKEVYGEDTYVWGTEISETAEQFEMTRKWDFSIPRNEWIGKFDIVYSNSFDHSITPRETLTTWINQLCSTGSLILEMQTPNRTNRGWKPNKSDPLFYTPQELTELIESMDLDIIESWPSPKFTTHLNKGITMQTGRPTLMIRKKEND